MHGSICVGVNFSWNTMKEDLMYVLICFHCELFYSKLHVNVKNCHVIKFKEPDYLYKHDIHIFSKGLLVFYCLCLVPKSKCYFSIYQVNYNKIFAISFYTVGSFEVGLVIYFSIFKGISTAARKSKVGR